MSRSTRQYIVIGAGVAVLCVAAILQGIKVKDVVGGDQSSKAQPIKLSDQLPHNLSDWSGRDEALGPNEVTRAAVERTLNYDDFVFRIFEKDGKQIGVYVAYWVAGRMPLQKVASHTPDRCWTENGWRCEAMRFSEPIGAGGTHLMPAQWRRFAAPNSTAPQYVVYWHLVGDRLYDYGTRFNARPDFLKWWRDTLDYAFSGSDAQYFIRVTSNRPFEELASEPAWTELVEALAKFGLGSKEQGAKR